MRRPRRKVRGRRDLRDARSRADGVLPAVRQRRGASPGPHPPCDQELRTRGARRLMLTQSDANHIFDKLRNGLVPERGLDAYAVGIEKPRDEIRRQLELVQEGSGHVKFLRGGYGCGKTFMARLAI